MALSKPYGKDVGWSQSLVEFTEEPAKAKKGIP